MKFSYKIVAFLAIALGVVHIAFTACLSEFDIDALWFAGSGLTIVFAGFLNLVLIRTFPKDHLVRGLCITANLITTILFVVAVLTVLQEPQVVVGIVIFALLTIFSILLKNE
ncbi:MAG: hypothetical protein WKF71_02920 [Pyrinomonadaceae bacterium]